MGCFNNMLPLIKAEFKVHKKKKDNQFNSVQFWTYEVRSKEEQIELEKCWTMVQENMVSKIQQSLFGFLKCTEQ